MVTPLTSKNYCNNVYLIVNYKSKCTCLLCIQFPPVQSHLLFGSVQVINYQKQKIALCFGLYKKSTTILSTQLKYFGHSQ